MESTLLGNDLDLVLAAIRAGQLCVIHHDGADGQRPLHLVTPSRRLLPARVRAFVELLLSRAELRLEEEGG